MRDTAGVLGDLDHRCAAAAHAGRGRGDAAHAGRGRGDAACVERCAEWSALLPSMTSAAVAGEADVHSLRPLVHEQQPLLPAFDVREDARAAGRV